MNLNIPVIFLKELEEAFPDHADMIHDLIRWSSDDSIKQIDAHTFSEEMLDKLQELAIAGKAGKVQGANGLSMKLTQYKNLMSDPTGIVLNRLDQLVTALKAYISKSPNKWLFHVSIDGIALPYYVSNLEYKAAVPNRNAASVTMSLKAIKRGDSHDRSVTWDSEDMKKGKRAAELLTSEGFYLETPEAMIEYEKHFERYKAICSKTGEQFNAVGTATGAERYSWGSTAMEREGIPTKVVMDDLEDETDDDGRSSRRRDRTQPVAMNTFWSNKKKNDEEDLDTVPIPVHPYVKVFDLDRHEYVAIHVSNLTEYKYDRTLINKLILPSKKKNLIEILVEGSTDSMDDIVKGKMRGVIVIATGAPGTGKTLTAEVFSEQIERPLYVVQCSQLGTNEDVLEKELTKVLARATRWKAILLIDEADVYVHERGSDIHQNAIVGVFLRVLEYYRGVLFMTSNKSTIIDDAVMSRATAWIQYQKPSADELKQIWKVLATNYKIELSTDDIDALAADKDLQHISGRNVRNLLKLARLLSTRRKEKVNVALIKYVAQFQDLEQTKEQNNAGN